MAERGIEVNLSRKEEEVEDKKEEIISEDTGGNTD